MRTINVTFTFPDGSTAGAILVAEGPEDFNPVRYTGAIDRLPGRPERASAVGIKVWAEDVAADLPCGIEVDESGEFDAWAL